MNAQAREPEAHVALYRLEVKVVSRGKQGASMVAGAAYRSGSRLVEHEHGRSAVAASAHLAGDRLEDGRGGVVHDFRGKAVVRSEMMLPPGAPESFYDRETLWNAAEAAENRTNSRVGREILAVLPRELSDAENLDLVRDFVRESWSGAACARISRSTRRPRATACASRTSTSSARSDAVGARRVRRQGPPVGQARAGHVAAPGMGRRLQPRAGAGAAARSASTIVASRPSSSEALERGDFEAARDARPPARRAPRAGRPRDGTRGHRDGHRRRAARDRGGERRACRRLRGGS